MPQETYQPRYEKKMDRNPLELTLVDIIKTLELTHFGKFQVKKLRETIIESIAYEKMQLTDLNLYQEVYVRGNLNGLLTLADLLDEFTIDPKLQDS